MRSGGGEAQRREIRSANLTFTGRRARSRAFHLSWSTSFIKLHLTGSNLRDINIIRLSGAKSVETRGNRRQTSCRPTFRAGKTRDPGPQISWLKKDWLSGTFT